MKMSRFLKYFIFLIKKHLKAFATFWLAKPPILRRPFQHVRRYMFVFATLFFVITGTIGFYSCYWFVWTIYGAIKVD